MKHPDKDPGGILIFVYIIATLLILGIIALLNLGP